MDKIMNTLSCIMAIALCSASCGKPAGPEKPADPRSLTFSKTQISIPATGGTFSVEVNANFTYKVKTDAAWLTEKDLSNTSAPVFQAESNEISFDRTAKIRFTDVEDRYYFKEVTVTQLSNPDASIIINIVDKQATPETKALLANLWAIADRGWMFGHHDDLWYGRYWQNQPGGSDTKAVCGDYPAVFSVDIAEIMDDRFASGNNAIRRRVILEARERGEVILACAHLNNPKTGKDSWDNSSNEVVREILTPGSATRETYLSWLDRCAGFALELKDSRGKLIPVIFRMFHEHTQNWSWWGTSCTSTSEFTQLWRMTIEYLRDTKGVHNFLYAISPQMDGMYADPKGRIQFRWPGDDWVDFLGMDCYHGSNNSAFISNLKALEEVSIAKKKPCGVTEDGIEGFTRADYWSTYIVAPTEGRRISMVTMWRNKYVGSNESDTHFYSVYPGHPSENDFRKMYDLDRTFFSKDLPDMYSLPEGYEIK